MKKATELSQLYNVLNPKPLAGDDTDFYYDKAMSVRTGDKDSSPLDNIFEDLISADSTQKFLFMGHSGCGKSTELNRLVVRLTENNFKVGKINTMDEIDLQNAAYWDLLILAARKIIEIAKEINCKIDKQILQKIETFWRETEVVETYINGTEKDIRVGAGISVPSIMDVINFFVQASAIMKFSNDRRQTIRQKIEQRAAEWNMMLSQISEEIARKQKGKYPVLVFENLDKLSSDVAKKIFNNYAYALSQIPVHVIYTFPIAYSYSSEFGAIVPYFNRTETLPMIKLRLPDRTPYPAGLKAIKNIIFLRADEKLFAPEALDEAILATGGSLRDLFRILIDASRRADKRNSAQIEFADVDYPLRQLSSMLIKRFDSRQHDILQQIYQGNKRQIKERDRLLELIQAQVAMEYNGENWYDIHPLVEKFLEEEKLVEKIER